MGLLDMFGRKPRTEGKKARKTREFKEESERLRKEALAKKPAAKPANRMGKGPSMLNPAEVKNRNTARFQAKSEALRKDALKKGAPEIKKAKFLAESERLKKAALAKDAAANKKENVTGKGGRNVGTGRNKKANVTKEQLDASGMSLRNYLNFMDKNGKRPPKAKKAPGGKKMNYKPKKMMGGGMAMKTKMGTKGGARGGAKGYKDGGKLPMVEKNGQMVPAYAADGKGKMMTGGPVKKMKTKGYSKGGVAGGKRNKVRGAGIARKGVRPAKMR